jgi:hypothetical protein
MLLAATAERETAKAREIWATYLEIEPRLRQSVREYAGLLRLIEQSPEATVIELKRVVEDGSATLGADRLAQRDLTSAVVQWAIEGYYEAAD